MTTIATDGKSIAADRRSCANQLVRSDSVCKLVRLKDGRVAALSGQEWVGRAIVAWLEGGDRPSFDSEAKGGVVVLSREGAHYIGKPLFPEKMDLPAQIGTGGEIALGAMLAGASPKRAVELAMPYDLATGGGVDVMEIE